MKKVIRIIMTIIQYILIVIGIAAILLLVVPIIMGYKPFVVKSGSMEPTVKTGAIAYNNTHVTFDEIKEGDIIVFKQGDSYVTHRAIKIDKDNKSFITKGDANETEDLAPVRLDQFKGKNSFSIPYLGYALEIVQTKVGVFIFILVAGLDMIYFIFSQDEDEKNKEPKEGKSAREIKDS